VTSGRSAAVDLEALFDEGARFVQSMRPVWRAAARRLPRGEGRRYFSFVVGLVAVAVAGSYVRSNIRHRREP
jgi:hypothetical protein